MNAVTSEVLASFELERLLHKAASTRFERTPNGFVCANPNLPSVWSATKVQVEPGAEMPSLERMRATAELPSQWHPELRHRTALIAGVDEGREVAFSLARHGWNVSELALMICRKPPKVPTAAGRVEDVVMLRLKGRLGVEHGLPPGKIAQFDRYDALRGRAAAHLAFGGFEAGRPLSLASVYLRGDIAVLEDVATLTRARGRGLGKAAVLAATAGALRLTARAVYLFAAPDVAKRFYEPLGFERIGGAWHCEKPPPG
ncbi:MAG: GNAT family N-acetyltransferase [Actinomycetota bacterium]|nr:GNAT family N-acetyltransferase [Actinomycetota bacterium]